ncbi:hypothetical protein DIPPA_04507 [Diplonema papillatum]|nr:hypothetical protein DIPPA_04507 [Diplonema papillatum]|eukprot:gene4915-7594_t
MRACCLAAALAAGAAFEGVSPLRTNSQLVVGVNGSVTYLSGYRQMTLELATGKLARSLPDPRHPSGGRFLTVQPAGFSLHDAREAANFSHPTHSIPRENVAHRIATAALGPSTPGCFGGWAPGSGEGRPAAGVADAEVCDLSFALDLCTGGSGGGCPAHRLAAVQSLEMRGHARSGRQEFPNAGGGRDAACAGKLLRPRSQPPATAAPPAGRWYDGAAVADYAGECSPSRSGGGALVTTYKLATIADEKASVAARWFRQKMRVDVAAGYRAVSYMTLDGTWRAGWPGASPSSSHEDEIVKLEFCNELDDLDDCITMTFDTWHNRGSLTAGDVETVEVTPTSAPHNRVYVWAEADGPLAGVLSIDYRLDEGEYAVFSVVTTHTSGADRTVVSFIVAFFALTAML